MSATEKATQPLVQVDVFQATITPRPNATLTFTTELTLHCGAEGKIFRSPTEEILFPILLFSFFIFFLIPPFFFSFFLSPFRHPRFNSFHLLPAFHPLPPKVRVSAVQILHLTVQRRTRCSQRRALIYAGTRHQPKFRLASAAPPACPSYTCPESSKLAGSAVQ
jgi:hypothetical protein